MADSTTNLDTISSSQAQKEVTANALFDAVSPAMIYGRRASTTTALTWGYYGGRVGISGTPTAIANGTVALSASTTNYVVVARATGAVSVSTATTNWNDSTNYIRLYEIVTGASSVTSYTDHRAWVNATLSSGSGDVATDAIWDAKGDLAVGTGANTAARLAVGTDGQVLTADSAEATGTKWATVAGTGDVVGPASATNNSLARYDGTTGKLLKDGAVIGADVASLVANTFTGLQQLDYSSDIASGATVDLGTATGNSVTVTHASGTTAITSFGGAATVQKGGIVAVIPSISGGTLTVTHHATNMILLGGANITLASGDVLLMMKNHDSNAEWKQVGGWKADGTAWVASSPVTTLSPIATTSGSTQTHSSIPAGVVKISIPIDGVSSNGAAVIGIQLGDSGGLETTGYAGCVNNFNGAGLASLSSSFALSTSGAAAQVLVGVMDLVLVDASTNTWSATWTMSRSDGTTGIYTGSGTKSLSGTLDRVAIVTTDAFDAGKFGCTYTVGA